MNDQDQAYAEAIAGGYDSGPEPPPLPEAVPVRIVGPVGIEERPTRQMTVGQRTVGTEVAVELLPAHPTRVRAYITAPDGVFIGPSRYEVTTASGFPVQGTIELTTRHAVWGIAEVGESLVGILAEHQDG